MVFVRDEGSLFDAPIEAVWEFVGSGDDHSAAHRHRAQRRERHSDRSGTYSWEQPFDGRPERFAMRWTSYWPLGIAYEVLEGPFTGSQFFLYYEPRGRRTAVGIVGEFRSPTIPPADVAAAVERFFTLEFEQDHAALRERATRTAAREPDRAAVGASQPGASVPREEKPPSTTREVPVTHRASSETR